YLAEPGPPDGTAAPLPRDRALPGGRPAAPDIVEDLRLLRLLLADEQRRAGLQPAIPLHPWHPRHHPGIRAIRRLDYVATQLDAARPAGRWRRREAGGQPLLIPRRTRSERFDGSLWIRVGRIYRNASGL